MHIHEQCQGAGSWPASEEAHNPPQSTAAPHSAPDPCVSSHRLCCSPITSPYTQHHSAISRITSTVHATPGPNQLLHPLLCHPNQSESPLHHWPNWFQNKHLTQVRSVGLRRLPGSGIRSMERTCVRMKAATRRTDHTVPPGGCHPGPSGPRSHTGTCRPFLSPVFLFQGTVSQNTK